MTPEKARTDLHEALEDLAAITALYGLAPVGVPNFAPNVTAALLCAQRRASVALAAYTTTFGGEP